MAPLDAHHSRGPRRLAARAAAVAVVAAFVAAAGAPSAHAFGTVWGILGQHSEHERVTRLALQCGDAVQPPECFQPASLDNLAGKRGSFGAVGAPDDIPIHLNRDRDYWHCDNADWLDAARHGLAGEYPQSRDAAIDKLRACVEWGKAKLYDGGGDWSHPTATPETGAVAAARQLIKRNGRVDDSNPGVGLFNPSCSYNGRESARPKCNVLEPFGYVLHMAEDFYSHTNWADLADPSRPLSLTNPVGLGNGELAPFLDLRAGWDAAADIPHDFTGSCYPKKNCAGRVIHGESSSDLGLNKDKAKIDTATGRVTEPNTPRGRVTVEGVTNVGRAIDGATREARRQWAVFRAELVQRYGADDAAKMVCALVLDRSETCDQRNVMLVLDTGTTRVNAGEGRGVLAGSGAARPGTPATATGERLLDRLQPTDRVSVLTFDSETGEQDLDPFTAPASADIDDAATGDPEPEAPADRAPGRRADPTVTPEPDPASPGHTPEGGYTHGSEEGGEGHAEPIAAVTARTVADPAAAGARAVTDPAAAAARAAADPAAAAARTAADPSPAADALASARAALGRANVPRGQQGVVLVTHRIGEAHALARQIRELRRDGVVVSLAVHGTDAVARGVLAAVEATGGTTTATHDEAELGRFAGAVDTAGMTRLDDALPKAHKATLHRSAPALLGVSRAGRDVHAVERLGRRATLRVRALDRPLTVVVTNTATLRTTRAVATRRRTARLALALRGNYEVTIDGPSGRRYEVTLR